MTIKRIEVDVFAQPAYPNDPQLVLEFEPRSIAIINMDQAIGDDIFVSFDGGVDHGRVKGGGSLEFRSPTRKVWLRRGAVGVSPTPVQVIAEG